MGVELPGSELLRGISVSSGLCQRTAELVTPDRSLALALPALLAQPVLKRPELQLGVAGTQALDVGLVAGVVEPVEHLKELLAERDPDNGHRQAPELDRAPEHTREHLGRLAVVSSMPAISSSPDEMFWSVERERDEFSNVVRGDRLVRPVLVKSTGRGEHLVDRPRGRLTDA